MTRAKRAALGVCVLGALAVGWGLAGWAPAAPVTKETPKGDARRLRQFQEERVKALEEQLQGQAERVKIGKDPLIQFIEAIRELGEAELDLADTREAKLAALERMVERLTECETEVQQLQVAGLQTKQGVAQARAARLKAQVQLEKFKLGR